MPFKNMFSLVCGHPSLLFIPSVRGLWNGQQAHRLVFLRFFLPVHIKRRIALLRFLNILV